MICLFGDLDHLSFVFSYLYLYCGNLDDLSFGNLYDAHLSLSFYNNKIRRHFLSSAQILVLITFSSNSDPRHFMTLSSQVQHVLFMVSGVFYYFNSILNPILYTILSKRFRRGFSDISGKCWVYQVSLSVLAPF